MPTSGKATVVLLVQRNDDLEMYAEFLTHKGLRAIPVSSGADALTAAADADIIVTGIALHGELTGIELVARLRADAHEAQTYNRPDRIRVARRASARPGSRMRSVCAEAVSA